MNSICFSFFEFIFGIALIYIAISSYSRYPEDSKRKIYVVVLGLTSFYYFVFSFIQLTNNYEIVNILNQISLILLLLATSISLVFLLEFLTGIYYKYFIKCVIISILFSIFISLLLIIYPVKPISLDYKDNIWQYKFVFEYSTYILLFYFILLALISLVYLIILLLLKSKLIFKIYLSYSSIFILPFIYFINFKNPYLLFFIQNIVIFVWSLNIYLILEKLHKEVINFYQFQAEIAEGLAGIEFLLNKDFYIIDTTDKSAKKIKYKKIEILGKNIENFITDFDCEKTSKYILANEIYCGIYKIKCKDNTFVPIELSFYKVLNKKNEIDAIILFGNDIENKQNFEFYSRKEAIARTSFANFLENLMQFLEILDEGIAFFGEKGQIIATNKSFLLFYKDLKENVLNISDFINSKVKTIEKTIEITKDYKKYYFNYLLSFIPKDKDFPLGYISLIENNTEKEKIKKNLQKIYDIFEMTFKKFPAGVIIFDKDCKITYFSDQLKTYSKKEDFVKDIWYKLTSNDYLIKSTIEEAKRIGFSRLINYKIDLSKIYSDKAKIVAFYNLSFFIINKEMQMYCLIIEDISDQFRYQRLIEKEKDKYENAIYEKISFISSLAYEVRKYIVNIVELSFLLIDEFKFEPQEFSKKIIENSEQLIKILDSIILYELIENNKLKLYFEKVEIVSYLSKLLETFKNFAMSKGLTFQYSILTKKKNQEMLPLKKGYTQLKSYNVLIDKELFGLIIENLVTNSIKFTEKGFINVLCKIKKLGHENYEISIKIKDSGIGIDKKNLRLIFNKYYQTDELLIKRYQGLGLGLYHVKRLLDYFGGQMRIISKLNEGTEVNLSLPLMKGFKENNKSEFHKNRFKWSNVLFILASKDETLICNIKNFCNKYSSTYQILDKTNTSNLQNGNKIYIFILNIDENKMMDSIDIKNLKDLTNVKSELSLLIGITNLPYIKYYIDNKDAVYDLIITRPINVEGFKKKIESYFNSK